MKRNLCVCLAMVLLIFCTINDNSVSAYTVAPNEAFTVSLSCGVMEGKIYVNAYNAQIVSASDWCDRGNSISIKGIAGSEGVAEISLVAVDVTNSETGVPFEGNISSTTIAIVNTTAETPSKPIETPSTPTETETPPVSEQKKNTESKTETTNKETKEENAEKVEKSTVSSLSELRVSHGVLSPAFRSDTHSYALNVDDSFTSITIDAVSSDQKAFVEGTGEFPLELGNKTAEIICKAEDGSTSTYTININVVEKPTLQLSYGTAKLGILHKADTSQLSGAFEEITITVDGAEVTAWKNEGANITLLYLMNEKMERDFYIYEDGKGVISIYRPIALCGKNLVMVDIPQNLRDRTNMSFGTVSVDGVDLQGWSFDNKDFESFVVIYMMDDQGNYVYYQYEATTNTLQPFSNAAAITQTNYEKYVDNQNRIMLFGGIGLGVLILVCIVFGSTTVLLYRRRKSTYIPNKKTLYDHDLGQDLKIESKVLHDQQAKNKEDS